jgi:CHAD domain-containing protein
LYNERVAKLRKSDTSDFDARSAVGRHLAASVETLQGSNPLAAASVHRVRKDLKRARAGLRLLRDAVGKTAYAHENARLRDAARPLAPLRDADVMLATFGQRIDAKKIREQRAALRNKLKKSLVQEIQASIAETGTRVSQWRLPHDAWPVLRSGLERIYRKGREALAGAQARGTDRRLHEARKQVKYLGAALEMIAPAAPRRVAKLAKRADDVAERLGDDHDLAMLRRRLGYTDRELIAWIDRRRRKLQKKALKDAGRLYGRKAKAFVARLEAAPVRSR